MTDWEQPHWSGRPQPQPDARPKLRPGFFAKLARFSVRHHLAVLGLFLLAGFFAASFAAVRLSVNPQASPRINFDPQTEAARQAIAERFPDIDQSFLAIVSDEDSGQSRAIALAVADTLRHNPNLFSFAFVPGTGAFYDANGVLFEDIAAIEARVNLALQMQPLFQAFSAAPEVGGLAALVAEIGRSVQQGRSPPGLEGVLAAASVAVEGEATGRPAPVDWARLAGLSDTAQSQRWFVIATPVAGAEPAAAAYARQVSGGAAGIEWLWPDQALAAGPEPFRDLGVPAGLAALVVLTILAAGLGALRLVVPVVLSGAVSVGLAAGTAALIDPRLDAATWAFAAAILAPALAMGVVLVLGHVQARQRGAGVEHAVMLALHRRGGLLVVLASIFAAFWMSWLVRQVPTLSAFAAIALIGTVFALITSLTLVPATLAAVDRDEFDIETHWLDAAIGRTPPVHSRNLSQSLSMVTIAAGVFCVIFLPSVKFGERLTPPDPPVQFDTLDARGAIHILSAPGDAANGLVQQLASLPEIGAIRWIEQFMPPDTAPKLASLKRLEGLVPGPADPPSAGDTATAQAAVDDLQAGLRAITGNPATGEGLRQAAESLDRAIAHYSAQGPLSPGRVLALNEALFGGLTRLSQTADRLARLPAPRLTDLEPALLRRFVARDGLWRIELMPKPGIRTLNFAAAVRRVIPQAAGEPVVALARNEIMHHEAGLAFAAALTAAMILGFVALRDFAAWLLILLPCGFFYTLSAAAFAGLGAGLTAALLASLSTASALSLAASIVLADGAVQSSGGVALRPLAYRAALLPVIAMIGAVAPLALSANPPVAEFGRLTSVFLIVGLFVNLALVPGTAQWLRRLTSR